MPTRLHTEKARLWIGVAAALAVVAVGYALYPTKRHPPPPVFDTVYPMQLYTKERDHVVGVLCENGMNNDCAYFLDAVKSVPNLRVAAVDSDPSTQEQPEFWFVFHRYDPFSFKTVISKNKDYKKEGNIGAFLYGGPPLHGDERHLREDSTKSRILYLLAQVE